MSEDECCELGEKLYHELLSHGPSPMQVVSVAITMIGSVIESLNSDGAAYALYEAVRSVVEDEIEEIEERMTGGRN